MTPKLHKTLKVSPETHYLIKLAAAKQGVTIADWLARIVYEHINGPITIKLLTPKEVNELEKTLQEELEESDYPTYLFRRDANGNLVKHRPGTGVTP
jgi:hypothetical protein